MNEFNPAGLSASMQSLFPAGVAAAVLEAPGDTALLRPEEAECLGGALPQRAREFAAGRLCARRALAAIGIHGFALRAGAQRQPLWPGEVVGSITHTAGWCAAVVGARRRFRALGLDTEIADHVGEHLWPRLFGAPELQWLESLPVAGRAAAAALLFSAKEAVYKCQFPLSGVRLGFHDVRIEPLQWSRGAGEFRVVPVRPAAPPHGRGLPGLGRFLYHGIFVSTGVALEAGGSD